MSHSFAEACQLLAVSLAARSLPFDFAKAELRAVQVADQVQNLHSRNIVVLTGSKTTQVYKGALNDFPDLISTKDVSTQQRSKCSYCDLSIQEKNELLECISSKFAQVTILITVAFSKEESEELSTLLCCHKDLCRKFIVDPTDTDDNEQTTFPRLSLLWHSGHSQDITSKVRDTFFESLGIPPEIEVQSLEPLVARVEIVTLRTAAAATSSTFDHLSYETRFFDINSRRFVQTRAPAEFAVFTEAALLPSASWKVLLDGRLYIEELGYVEHGRPNLIESWPDFGASWSIRKSEPTFRLRSSGRFTFLLGGDVAHYHLLLNWLPRLRALDHPYVKRLLGARPQIAVSARFSNKELQLIERLTDCDIDFLFLPEAGIYHISNLIVPRFFSHHELTSDVSNWYREKLGVGPISSGRRIYISRSDARMVGTPRRKIVNEAEVVARLSTRGFEAVELSNKSIDEQIEIFRNVEFVIGPHGAGFANMMFAPSGAAAIVVENSWAHTFIADMLNVAGHVSSILPGADFFDPEYETHMKFLGCPDAEIRRSRDMLVDCDALTKMVDEILSRRLGASFKST